MKRPIVLISITPSNDPDVTNLPLLGTRFLAPHIDLEHYDGIILTSKKAIDALEGFAPGWKTLDILCVGKATQRQALALGAKVLERSDGYGAGLYDIVKTRYPSRRWLYTRPKVVASDFAQRLRDDGIVVDEAIVYETVCKAANDYPEPAHDAVLIFTSPSALKCFQKRFRLRRTHGLVVIGHTTARVVGEDIPVHIAPEPSVKACVTLAKQLAAIG